MQVPPTYFQGQAAPHLSLQVLTQIFHTYAKYLPLLSGPIINWATKLLSRSGVPCLETDKEVSTGRRHICTHTVTLCNLTRTILGKMLA